MKKFLFSTTALAVAGAFAFSNDASAAAKPISIGVGGFMSQEMGFGSNSGTFDTPADGTGTRRDSFNTVSDSEIYFTGTTKLDSGISVSVTVQGRRPGWVGATTPSPAAAEEIPSAEDASAARSRPPGADSPLEASRFLAGRPRLGRSADTSRDMACSGWRARRCSVWSRQRTAASAAKIIESTTSDRASSCGPAGSPEGALRAIPLRPRARRRVRGGRRA